MIVAFDVEGILVDAGFEAECLATCESALAWLEKHRPDVAICDIHLQDGPCDRVVRRLAELGIPYVVFSGSVPEEEHGPVFNARAWIEKPARPDQVITAVREALA